MKEIPRASAHAKRLVAVRNVLSALSILIEDFIIREIIKYTEIEARMKLNFGLLRVGKEENYRMLALIYGRGLIGKVQPVSFLWSKV